MDPAWVTAAAALGTAVAGCLVWAGRQAWRILRRIIHFLDDYAGQPARDGLPARPGFMGRLGSVEETLAQVLGELQPNHGASLRDVVHRAARDVADVKQEQAAVRTRLESFEAAQREGKA